MENHPPLVPNDAEQNFGIVPPVLENVESRTSSSDAFGTIPQSSEGFGHVPSGSAQFRTIPNRSERDGTGRSGSEQFRTVPQDPQPVITHRNEAHTITVREAARMFEAAGVARTERSVVKWCQRDASGSARLDAYFDMNERRYYITEQSIQTAIEEEKAKAVRNVQNVTEHRPMRSEASTDGKREWETSDGRPLDTNVSRKELLDLQILNAGKDIVIRQLREERDDLVQQMMEGSRKIGELETRLLQLKEPLDGKTQVG